MNLEKLLNKIGEKNRFGEKDISFVTEKIEKVTENCIFVAVKGTKYNGNDFVDEALKKGAAVVITEEEFDIDKTITVTDARLTLSILCSEFYENPQNSMKMIGITGTNGKTTTAHYIKHILEYAGKKCAIIGTLGCESQNFYSNSGYTTPIPEDLYCELKKFSDENCEYCVMEVSSQALSQKRTDPINFNLAILTNIGFDHLDYHKTQEEYIKAKTRLFACAETALINKDCPYSVLFEDECKTKPYFYSVKGKYADFTANDIRYNNENTSFIALNAKSLQRIQVPLVGEIAVYNTLCAVSAVFTEGIDFSVCARALITLPEIKGRLQKVYSKDFSVYIDYAHTPDALFAVLSDLKRQTNGCVICVFGCGGDRDKGKRSKMGQIASSFCDVVIITTDNPRSENPKDIADDIYNGIKNKNNIYIELDRYSAIELALKKAKKGDAVLIAGKGHETYQLSQNEKKFFSDELTVKKLLMGIN